MEIKLTAVFRKFPEGYAAFVEELPGANTQGATLDEARENLKEAVAMVLQANRELAEESLRGAEVVREPLALDRMKRRDLLRHLEKQGCEFLREGGNHTIYVNRRAQKSSAIPRHREIIDFLARKICNRIRTFLFACAVRTSAR